MSTHINDNLIIIEILGEGSFGKVYKCLYKKNKFEKIVAVKTLKPSSSKNTQYDLFLNEAKNVANLNHPNICQVYDISQDREGNPIIIYEFLEGKSLRDVIDNYNSYKLSEEDSYNIYKCILIGLRYAHTNDIIHHDINPNNIILTSHGQVKIIDFGLSKYIGIDSTIDGSISGTVNYYDPFLIQSKLPYDAEADIFSASLIFFELLTGHRLFSSPSLIESIQELQEYKGVVSTDLENISNPEFKNIIVNSLQLKRNKRSIPNSLPSRTTISTSNETIINRKISSNRNKKNLILPVFIVTILVFTFLIYINSKSSYDLYIENENSLYPYSISEKSFKYKSEKQPFLSTKVCNYIYKRLLYPYFDILSLDDKKISKHYVEIFTNFKSIGMASVFCENDFHRKISNLIIEAHIETQKYISPAVHEKRVADPNFRKYSILKLLENKKIKSLTSISRESLKKIDRDFNEVNKIITNSFTNHENIDNVYFFRVPKNSLISIKQCEQFNEIFQARVLLTKPQLSKDINDWNYFFKNLTTLIVSNNTNVELIGIKSQRPVLKINSSINDFKLCYKQINRTHEKHSTKTFFGRLN